MPTESATPTPARDRYRLVIDYEAEWGGLVTWYHDGKVVDSRDVGGVTAQSVTIPEPVDRIMVEFRPSEGLQSQSGTLELRRDDAVLTSKELEAEPALWSVTVDDGTVVEEA